MSEQGRGAARILVVDDEAAFARAVATRVRRAGYECETAGSLAEAGERLGVFRPDLVVLDMRLPDGSGQDFLASLREGEHVDVPVVVVTAFGDLDDAVAAMKQQALDYLTKPIDLDELVVKLESVLDRARLARKLEYSRQRESHAREEVALLGDSEPMRGLRAQIDRIRELAGRAAETPPTVLVLGETGTGKDLAARALHTGSRRSGAPFVHVDCAALPKDLIEAELFGHEKGAFTGAHAARTGLIEAAEDGTLFLDEIGEVPLDVQSRLLAVLERRSLRRVGSTRERPVAAWFVAATNRPLEAMVAEGGFRSDLYYRLKVLTLHLPPLRERGDDAQLLAAHYAARTARRYGLPEPALSEDARIALRAYAWPGNVRELVNVVERAVLLSGGGELDAASLGLTPAMAPTPHPPVRRELAATHAAPPAAREAAGDAAPAPGSPLLDDDTTLPEMEARLIRDALRDTRGNVSAAARRLGVSRMRLRYRLQKYDIDPAGYAR